MCLITLRLIIAFSLIMYDEKKQVLYAAISDFGVGIANSVRKYLPSIDDDRTALLKAVENNFTVKSTGRNKGKGLDNILSCADVCRIFSGNGLLVDNNGDRRCYDVDFFFQEHCYTLKSILLGWKRKKFLICLFFNRFKLCVL